MKVKVKKRKVTIDGTVLFKGTQLELSEDKYKLYKDELELVEQTKTNSELKHNKQKKKYKKEFEE